MKAERLKMSGANRYKLAVRDAYASCLSLLPMSLLDPLRALLPSASTTTRRRTVAEFLLRALRYRHLDNSIDSFSPPDRPDVRFANVDSLIVRRVYWLGQGGYEGPESHLWERCCSRATGILEIGANIGFYTVLGARAAAGVRYVAVEPHPISVGILRRNVALNALSHVHVVNAAAVGKKSAGQMTLMVPLQDHDAAPSGAYLETAAEGQSRQSRPTEVVSVLEAAELMDGIDLLKLDVEGHEHEILSSIAHYVEAKRPTIFVEVLDETPRLRALLSSWCERIGYSAFVFRNGRLTNLPPADLLRMKLWQLHDLRDVILSVGMPGD